METTILFVFLILGVSASPTTQKPTLQENDRDAGFLFDPELFGRCLDRHVNRTESDENNHCNLQCFLLASDVLVSVNEGQGSGENLRVNKEKMAKLKPDKSIALDNIISKCETVSDKGNWVGNCVYTGCLSKNGIFFILIDKKQ